MSIEYRLYLFYILLEDLRQRINLEFQSTGQNDVCLGKDTTFVFKV